MMGESDSVSGARLMPRSKWTPGPWSVGRVVDDAGPKGDFVILSRSGNALAMTNADLMVNESNARLIAVAPEMAEALQALMGGDDKLQVAIGGNPIYVDKFLEKTRAILANSTRPKALPNLPHPRSTEMNLDELERLAKAATPGPYRRSGDHKISGDGAHIFNAYVCAAPGQHAANAAYIAACSPETILGLIARIRELEGSK